MQVLQEEEAVLSHLQTSCEFCTPLDHLLIKQTENFSVLYDPFPLIPGHLMISTRLHYGCGGELDPHLMEELIEIKTELTQVLKESATNVISYEHGRAGACQASSSAERVCHHMHLHVLPFDHDVSDQILSLLPNGAQLAYSEAAAFFNNSGNYVFFENPEQQGAFFAAQGHEVPSHLVRTIISKQNYTPELADWRKYRDRELFNLSLKLYPRNKFKRTFA